MKTLKKSIFVLVAALVLQSLLMAQAKTGDRSKKSSDAKPPAAQTSADKKTAADNDKAAATSTTATKLEDNKSKDPLENMKFRNLGPAVGGGRVTAVDMIFIGTSNEFGQFESGVTAQWFGTVPAVVLGGIGTLVVIAAWAWLFPELRQAGELTSIKAPSLRDGTEIESPQ